MSANFVPLAVLMALATYPFRALPLLAPVIDRVAGPLRLYLTLLAPAVLAALAAVSVAVVVDGDRPSFHVGVEWLAVVMAMALVAVRRNLLLGLVLGAAGVALLRAAGVTG